MSPTPRSIRTTLRRFVVPALLVFFTLAVLAGCGSEARKAETLYTCPMHPDYVSDHPGDCPVCGMRLVKKKGTSESASAPAAKSPEERRPLYYRSPMNPAVTSPTPAKDPMGMDFVPVYAEDVAPRPAGSPGLAPVELTPEAMRLAGVATEAARMEETGRTIRAAGTVVPDERRTTQVHTRISGWVERLFVNATGQLVKRGQPMLEIYSPELLATQEEYLRAREARARFSTSSLEEVRKGGEDLYEAARRRLDLLGFPEAAFAELERTGKARRTVRLPSPASGFVLEKQVFEGARIEPETPLFRIVDLSRIWLEAALYESDAPSVRLGQAARVSLPSDPAHPRSARVAYLYPALDPATRTLRVRFELANPGLTLKPGMFADVELTLASQRQLTIPDSAILATGERRVVFVATAPSRFEPREIELGARAGGRAVVLSGLKAGDQVVVRANFLLDSESRLRAALAGRSGGGTPP